MPVSDLPRRAVRTAFIGTVGVALAASAPTRAQPADEVAEKVQSVEEAPADPPKTAPETEAQTRPSTGPSTRPAAVKPKPAPVDPAVAAKVKSLLDDLADPDWKARKKAADELERLGESAEAAMEEALKHRDLSVDARTTLEVLLKQAAERRRTGATLVTIDLVDAKPVDAVADVLKAGDLKLSDDAKELLQSATGTIDLKLDREPLLSALNKVAAEAGLGFTGLSGDEVSLAPLKSDDKAVAGPAIADGPFMLAVQRVEVTVRKAVEFAGPRGGGNPMANAFNSPPVRISVAAFAEPRVKPGMWMLEGVSNIKTDKGKELTAQVYGYSRNTKVNDGSTTYVTLSGDTDGAASITSMTVSARFILQWNTETFEVDNVQKANEVSKIIAGNRVVLKQMRKVGDNWTYEVTLHRDNRPPEEWTALQQTIDRNGCKVVDADGKALQQRGSGSSWSSNEIRINGTVSQANGVGEPVKLTWELPGKIETLPGSFEFKNVPLP